MKATANTSSSPHPARPTPARSPSSPAARTLTSKTPPETNTSSCPTARSIASRTSKRPQPNNSGALAQHAQPELYASSHRAFEHCCHPSPQAESSVALYRSQRARISPNSFAELSRRQLREAAFKTMLPPTGVLYEPIERNYCLARRQECLPRNNADRLCLPHTAPCERSGRRRSAGKSSCPQTISRRKPAEIAPVSRARDHTTHSQRQRQTQHPVHVPVWPRRKSAEDPDERSASAAGTQWRPLQTKDHRKEKRRDEGLYGTGQNSAGHVRPA